LKNSRQKGNVAEREVAKLLTTWWKQAESETQFIRTPLSGGWSNAEVRGEFKASGDLMTTAQHFPFCVEVKRREAWNLDRVNAGLKSPVWSWWRQAQTQANEQCTDEKTVHPMLWLRQSRMPWLVMLPQWLVLTHFFNPSTCFACITPKKGVDVGAFEPMLVSASHLLSLDPCRFVQTVETHGIKTQETSARNARSIGTIASK